MTIGSDFEFLHMDTDPSDVTHYTKLHSVGTHATVVPD